MTQRLEDLFNLPKSDPDQPEAEQTLEQNRELLQSVDDAIDKIDAALPGVRDLDTGDEELDDLAELAKEKAKDLIDLGMNVDPRFAGVILQTASQMLGHSITAKTAKLDKKLRMINLQLQKAKFDHAVKKDADKAGEEQEQPIDGQGVVIDRNELLKQILNRKD
jgi:predicted ATP-grasp superfamily ATP-dependent carboligase